MEKSGIIESLPATRLPDESVQRSQRPRKWWHLGGKDVSFVTIDDGYETVSQTPSGSSSPSAAESQENVFVAPEALELYKPVEGFEGTHRFDPSATWTKEEERRLVRRVCIDSKLDSAVCSHK